MSASDYYRPAANQISRIYRCTKCGDEQTVDGQMSATMPCYYCKGFVEFVGESYPAETAEWDEERYPNGDWGPRR